MSAIIVLVIVSVTVAVFFLILFIKSVRAGQYEDDYSPAVRILFDPTTTTASPKASIETSEKSKQIDNK